MDSGWQVIEEEITKERFPITYAIIKNGLDPKGEKVLQWLKWYAGREDTDIAPGLTWPVYAQVDWEPDETADQLVGLFTEVRLAESCASAHNVALERVQRADFGRTRV